MSAESKKGCFRASIYSCISIQYVVCLPRSPPRNALYLFAAFSDLSHLIDPKAPTLHLQIGKPTCSPPSQPTAARFGAPGVMLTHAELGRSAQDELGGLDGAAVVGAVVGAVQPADVQPGGVVGTHPVNAELLLADVCAICGFSQRIGK